MISGNTGGEQKEALTSVNQPGHMLCQSPLSQVLLGRCLEAESHSTCCAMLCWGLATHPVLLHGPCHLLRG